MKLDEEKINIVSSGITQEQAFGIGNIGMVLEILRSKMYQDPISAIVREICSNARDAHREVGKSDLPIEISLPNSFDLNFRVRDFGPGISDDRMANVFTQYANSTKRSDNIQTGGFGLGAKTPFSYSDTFTIITIVNGVKKTYTAYIDESKMGKLALLKEEPTSDSNGTTIVVPVKKDDCTKFRDVVNSVLCFWDVLPKITAGTVHFTKFSNKIQVLNFSIVEGKFDYNESWPKAIIDGIQYHLNFQSLLNHSSSFEKFREFFNNTGVILKFNNGDLSLSANRDHLHYDQKTCDFIYSCMEQIQESFVPKIALEIDKQKTYIDACKTLHNFKSNYRFSSFKNDFLWNNWKVIPNNLQNLTMLDFVDKIVICCAGKSGTHYVSGICRNDNLWGGYYSNVKLFTFGSFTNDILKAYCDSSHPGEEVVFVFLKEKYKGKVEDIIKSLGFSELLEIKQEILEKKKRIKKKEKESLLAYDFNGHTLSEFQTVEIKDEGGYYVIVDRDLCSIDLGNNLSLKFRDEKFKLFNLVDNKISIWGFTKARASRLSKDWKLVSEQLFNSIKNIDDEVKNTVYNYDSFAFSEFNILNRFDIFDYTGFVKTANETLDSRSLFLEYLNECQRVRDYCSDKEKIKNMSTLKVLGKIPSFVSFNFGRNSTFNRNNLSLDYESTKTWKLLQKICKHYPLLISIGSLKNRYAHDAWIFGNRYDECQLILDYIRMVDAKKEYNYV